MFLTRAHLAFLAGPGVERVHGYRRLHALSRWYRPVLPVDHLRLARGQRRRQPAGLRCKSRTGTGRWRPPCCAALSPDFDAEPSALLEGLAVPSQTQNSGGLEALFVRDLQSVLGSFTYWWSHGGAGTAVFRWWHLTGCRMLTGSQAS